MAAVLQLHQKLNPRRGIGAMVWDGQQTCRMVQSWSAGPCQVHREGKTYDRQSPEQSPKPPSPLTSQRTPRYRLVKPPGLVDGRHVAQCPEQGGGFPLSFLFPEPAVAHSETTDWTRRIGDRNHDNGGFEGRETEHVRKPVPPPHRELTAISCVEGEGETETAGTATGTRARWCVYFGTLQV